jgi:hypothetical protein
MQFLVAWLFCHRLASKYSLRAARRAMYAFHKASLMRAFSNDEYIAITMALHEID